METLGPSQCWSERLRLENLDLWTLQGESRHLLLLPDAHFSIDRVSVHWISFLLEHLQPALYSMLRTDGFALPHVLLSGRDCCHSTNTRYGLVSESCFRSKSGLTISFTAKGSI